MRCRDAKKWLTAQREENLTQPDASALQEHLKQCSVCRTLEQQQRHMDSVLRTSMARVQTRVSTDKIMYAVQQRRQITAQLEDIHTQQQQRIAQMRTVGTALAALGFFTLGSIPLLVLAITIIQTDLMVKALSWLGTVIDVLIILAQYLQAGLTLTTRNNWLLSVVAFAVVVMMGIWLRLMRHPQEA